MYLLINIPHSYRNICINSLSFISKDKSQFVGTIFNTEIKLNIICKVHKQKFSCSSSFLPEVYYVEVSSRTIIKVQMCAPNNEQVFSPIRIFEAETCPDYVIVIFIFH